jgi:DNA-binding MarR family transcriptional regulator
VGLQQEIKQKKPFQSPGQEAKLAILKTADTIRREMLRIVAPHGLSMEQYNVLRILRGAGCDGLPTLEVAARMIEQTPAITRLIDKLEAKGLVERVRSQTDRRQVYCRISRAGLKLLADLDEPVREANDRIGGLSKAEIRGLVSSLEKIRESLR